MVWHTHTGDRVLDSLESKFYLSLLQDSFESTLEFNNWDYDDLSEFQLWASTGNSFFDRASFNQQIFLLNFCLKALLKPDVEMPELNHLLEAAAFYPFAYLLQMIDEEINNQLDCQEEEDYDEDAEKFYRYRKIAWNFFEQRELPGLLEYEKAEYGEGEDNVFHSDNLFYEQKYKSNDIGDWEWAIDCLADKIFWDRDWHFVSTEPQLLDGMDEKLAYLMGISDDYFTNRLPKVTDEEASLALMEIMEWELPEGELDEDEIQENHQDSGINKSIFYRNFIMSILLEYEELASEKPNPSGVKNILVFDKDRDQYLWLEKGWDNNQKFSRVIIHVSLRDEKIYVEQDSIEDGITQKLLNYKIIPKEDIILAFDPPEIT